MAATEPLFTARARSDNTYARHDETWFDFLDRVDDVVFDRIRTLLDCWFAELPAEKAARLREELGSGRDVQVEGAFCELFLHATLLRTPLSVEVEPGRAAGRQPDFRCWPADDESREFLVEARSVGDPPARRAREKRLKRALDDVNEATPPGFSVFVSIVREGAATPRGAELRRRIVPWLEGLDRPTLRGVVEEARGRPELPEEEFALGDWVFRVRAWPLATEVPLNPRHRLIGVEPVRSAWGGSSREFAQALRSKRSRYELGARPYVIALGNTHSFQSGDDPVDVLHGEEAVQLIGEPGGDFVTRAVRRPNGFFRPDRNRRVSAVLHIPRLSPWNIAEVEPELWLNPFASNPMSVRLGWAAQLAPAGGTLERQQPERRLRDVFALPEVWPGPEKTFESGGSA